MTNERHQSDRADIAILGGGPAGLESALVLSRTRKRIIVFDDPEPPRNAASHGVHNYLGLDGVSPTDFREIAWKQIDKYDSVELCKEKIANVTKEEDGIFNITSDKETSIKAKKVILAIGYHDVYPNIPGFIECWSDTIFSCPFCDGYENRDQIWGIVVNSEAELERFPKMAQNWTSKIKVFISPKIEIKSSYQNELTDSHISVYRGTITNVNHTNTKVKSVYLSQAKKLKLKHFFGYLQ